MEASPKIDIRLGTRLKEISGDGTVQRIHIQSRGGVEEALPASGAFVYLQGGKPITDYLMAQLETKTEGCLVVDDEMQTAVPGIFAIGDLLCTHIKQAVIASADGVIAAVAADKYINVREKVKIDWK